MSRAQTLLLITAVWAAIYLPCLGSFEIKGEEGRRILPAMTMIESGNYLVPEVGGEAYLRKPPLINWIIAASFKIFGTRSEWTARVPSVLCMLAVAIAFVTVARASLGPVGSTIAALVWLTNVGMMAKGRLIEIEALYVSLCALAMIFWLSWWQEKRSPWLTWIIPWIFLGIGLLAKGPTHLIFFYALVLAVLWKSKGWRQLFHPAHLIGILVMLSIFAAWAIPLLHAQESQKVMNKWSVQFTGRVTGEFFSFWPWISNIPKSIGYFFPWLAAVPFIRFNKFETEHEGNLARALAWGVAVPLIVVGLIPGGAPRYSLPAMVPFCWLMGMTLGSNAFAEPAWVTALPGGPVWLTWPGRPLWNRLGRPFVVLAVIAGLIGFPIASVVMRHRQKVKSISDQINAVVPPTETLYAVDPNYQPFFFYMHAPVKYLSSVEEIPYEARYFLVRPNNEGDAGKSEQWSPRHAHSILRVKDYRDQTVIVFAVGDS